MDFNRPEAKMRARASMRGTKPHPMLVALIFMLVTTGVSELIALVLNTSQYTLYMDFLAYIEAGYDPLEVIQYMATSLPATGILNNVITTLVSVYCSVVAVGYTSYALRLARHEAPSYRNLLDGFHMIFRALGMLISQWFFITLWTIAAMIPCVIVLTVGIIIESTAVIVLGGTLFTLGLIFSATVAYRYRLAIYFLLDDQDMGALASITASKKVMRGRKFSLFVLDLSFIGWSILSMFTFGILDLWLLPYMYTTEANFYDVAVHGRYSAPDVQEQPPIF